MMRPDYQGDGIVNLMRSIGEACGAPVSSSTLYHPLKLLDASTLNEARHILLLVIDGLGYNYLMNNGQGGALHGALRGHMTSVFPSTTATAITAFMSGVAPQQHALTGWHIYFEELNAIAAVLPLTPRGGKKFDVEAEKLPSRLFNHEPIFNRITRPALVFSPHYIARSPFSLYNAGRAEIRPYKKLDDLFIQLSDAVRGAREPSYIYAYYPDLDALAHEHGIASAAVAHRFAALDAAFGELLHHLRDTDSVVIATGDHGFIDAPDERLISLEAHPELAETLVRPLCGERRVAYCYVKPAMHAQFVGYVQDHFAHCTEIIESADLIAQGWFGLGPPHPHLASRVGDYTLIMKEDWTIKDSMPGESMYHQIGVHGGVSHDEMLVPLIVAGR